MHMHACFNSDSFLKKILATFPNCYIGVTCCLENVNANLYYGKEAWEENNSLGDENLDPIGASSSSLQNSPNSNWKSSNQKRENISFNLATKLNSSEDDHDEMFCEAAPIPGPLLVP